MDITANVLRIIILKGGRCVEDGASRSKYEGNGYLIAIGAFNLGVRGDAFVGF